MHTYIPVVRKMIKPMSLYVEYIPITDVLAINVGTFTRDVSL